MKKVALVILLVCSCITLSHALAKAESTTLLLQQFVSHQVKEGETVYSISKAYGISEKEIYKLNPDAKSRIYEGLVLILPGNAQKTTATIDDQKPLKFKTHKVKRKETLYSISKKYNVPEDIIKKYNKELYSKPLRKGAKIQIPINYKEVVSSEKPEAVDITTSSVVTLPDTKEYVVKAKETKYGIARRYGITIAELEKLNPSISAGLKEGAVVKVPNIATETPASIDETQFSFYEVKKGNTIYSLTRQFNVSADALVGLNPAVADGLKEGMVLKVPKGSAGSISTDYTDITITSNAGKASLVDSIQHYAPKKIAVMLPFGLKRAVVDTADVRKNLLKSDRILRLALDFHSGILMAVKDAEALGIQADVTVYDTEYERIPGTNGKATNARKVENIIRSNDFTDVDALIGPLLGGNVDRAASLLASRNIPVISPVTQQISGGSNVFQSRPSDAILEKKMLDYLKANGQDKNIVIIADAKNGKIKSKLKAIFPNAKEVNPRTGDNGVFLYEDDISPKIDLEKENWVILETDDIPLISSVTTRLNAQRSVLIDDESVQNVDITLFTTHRDRRAYDSDEIQHMQLMNLKFHFPSMDKEFGKDADAFIDAYEEKYRVTPGRDAIRGYDIMMDTLLRLAYAENMFDAAKKGIETKYIENKFRYSSKGYSGFYNDAVYIMRYDENLTLKEVTSDIQEEPKN